MSVPRRARGFTLLELLVASALLAVLAVLSWRGMDSVLQGRERIVSVSDDLRAMTVTLAQMEEDLRRSWPIRLLGLPDAPIAFSPGSDRDPPAMALLRETRGADAVQVQRVVYRLRDGVFERGFSVWAAPSPDGASQVPPTPFTWQPLLPQVQSVQFRGWLQGRGWMPASTLSQVNAAAQAAGGQAALRAPTAGGVGAAAADTPRTVLPAITGIEVTLVRHGERIVRVFAVTD